MTENKIIYNDICRILDEVVSLSKGQELSVHENEINGLRIWKYTIYLPKKEQENIYFVLPNINSKLEIELNQIFGEEKYYIIDCFNQFEQSEKITDPRSFFINFLFNSKGYNDYFKENSVFSDIEKLYTKRSISFFNDADSLKNDSSTLENLLVTWQSSGKNSLLILGERGIGKSWAVLNYCYINYKLHRHDPWLKPLPIYLKLRGLSENIPGITNIGELIYYHLINQYDIKIFGGYFLFSALLKFGKIILVLDGLDEMSKEVSKEITIKNIWQIFSIYSNTSKFILTSRINFFHSRIQIKEHFAWHSFQDFKSQNPFYRNGIYNEEERRVRQDFNIWEIIPLQNREKIKLLERVVALHDEQINNGLDKLIKFTDFGENTMQKELTQLSDTPGYFIPVIKLLAVNKFPSLIEIYEECINTVTIDFNIESDRAIDKYKTITIDKTIEGHAFEAEQKNLILRKLAWYMIERNIYEFDIIEFPKFLVEIDDIDFDVVLSDLQTQTVITLKEEGKYSFITESIFAFYVANYLYLSLISQNNNEALKGIQSLGKYDFREGDILPKVKLFLQARIESLTQRKNDKENEIGNEIIKEIIQMVINVFKSDRPYSPWLKYLSSNLKMIGIYISEEILKRYDLWNSCPISNQKNNTDKKMVLIPGDNKNKPFFLGVTEVTNKDYCEFLESNEFIGDSIREDCLGHYWKRIEVFGKGLNKENPYLDIINYYHIIFWTEDKIPLGKQDHPVVWISWFAAAKYCNWLSRKENIMPYYTFRIENNKFIKLDVNKNAPGYRLPSEEEWKLAASEGNSEAETVLDLCVDDRDKDRIKRKFFTGDVNSTSPVKSENPNKYGVYGLMGNVREWVDNPDRITLLKFDEQIIKGMGWLLGEEGFEFNHSTTLFAQNNNVDVGFRIARSLTKEELIYVQNAYSFE